MNVGVEYVALYECEYFLFLQVWWGCGCKWVVSKTNTTSMYPTKYFIKIDVNICFFFFSVYENMCSFFLIEEAFTQKSIILYLMLSKGLQLRYGIYYKFCTLDFCILCRNILLILIKKFKKKCATLQWTIKSLLLWFF